MKSPWEFWRSIRRMTFTNRVYIGVTMTTAPQSRSGVHVLVVDDYRPIADLLAKTMRAWGYKTRAAYSAAEAFRVAEEFKPNALIADVLLPDMDGWGLGAEFEQRFPGCGVLLMSADIYLNKPPPDARPFKLVQKSTILDELEQLIGS
jgi:DNA-binding NtrC family response regulator